MESGASLNLDVDAWGDDGQSCAVYWLGSETQGGTLRAPPVVSSWGCAVLSMFFYVGMYASGVRESEKWKQESWRGQKRRNFRE